MSQTSQKVKHQSVLRSWWQGRGFKRKVALAIAALTLPVLVVGTTFDFVDPTITNQNNLDQQVRGEAPAEIGSVPPKQLPLTLVIETVVAALLLIGLLAAYFANRAMRPVVTAATDQESDQWEEPALSAPLATQASFTLDQTISEQQEAESEQTKLLTEITLRIRECLHFEDVLRTAVKEVRRALKADRVLIYSLNPTNWDGVVIAESVAPGWPQTLRVKLDDPCFRDRHVELYKQGQAKQGHANAINDIYQDPRVTDGYRKMLEQFGVKANLVAPILKENQLLGLIIAHQCSGPRNWQKLDIDLFAQLATRIGFALDQASFLEQQEAAAERTQLVTEITLRLRQGSYPDDVLSTTVKEVRRALKTDRVLIYGLDPNSWDGVVVAESVALGWPQILRVKLDDPCFRDRHVELYKQGQVTVINDIYQDPRVTDCYRKMLEQFAVKANLVAPIITNNQLLGLMIAHQCSEPRTWQKLDIDLFSQLATQVGFAIDQASIQEQLGSKQALLGGGAIR